MVPSRRAAVSRSLSMAKDCTFSSVNSARIWLYGISPERRMFPARCPTNITTRTTSSSPVTPNLFLSNSSPPYAIQWTPCQLCAAPMEMATSTRACISSTGMYGSFSRRLS